MSGSGPPQLVILDCDGVLVDSERLAVHVEARVLTELGWPHTADEVVARWMGSPPAGCVVVEDSVYGVRAGVAAGMRVLGYAGGLTSAEALAAEGAAPFESMPGLAEALLPSPTG